MNIETRIKFLAIYIISTYEMYGVDYKRVYQVCADEILKVQNRFGLKNDEIMYISTLNRTLYNIAEFYYEMRGE